MREIRTPNHKSWLRRLTHPGARAGFRGVQWAWPRAPTSRAPPSLYKCDNRTANTIRDSAIKMLKLFCHKNYTNKNLAIINFVECMPV